MNDKPMKVIRSQKLAGTLMVRGFVLVKMEKDNCSDSGRNVFFFNDSPQLDNAIREYSQKH